MTDEELIESASNGNWPHGGTILMPWSAIVIHYISARYADPDHPFSVPDVLRILNHEGLSYHAIVDRDGKVYRLLDPKRLRAFHAGVSELWGEKSCNTFALGFSLIGMPECSFTDAQYRTLADLCAAARRENPAILLNRIVGHQHVSHKLVREDAKQDPGPTFDWSLFFELLTRKEFDYAKTSLRQR